MGAPTVKIAVCIKRTPDSESRFRIAPSGAAIDEAGLKFDIDDFAGYAVEVALQLNEKSGGGETVVVAVGPDLVQESLRKAMSMGADRAVQLKTDGAAPADGLAVAKALAAELKAGGFDLVLFGKHAFDTSSGVVGIRSPTPRSPARTRSPHGTQSGATSESGPGSSTTSLIVTGSSSPPVVASSTPRQKTSS